MSIDLIDRFLEAKLDWGNLINRLDSLPDPQYFQFALQTGPPIDLHLSVKIPSQSFENFAKNARNYLNNIEKTYLRDRKDGWLENKDQIKSKFPRPEKSKPIYFIVTEENFCKKIVYIGKTSFKTGRFDNGHVALTKLHHPKYAWQYKSIHMFEVLVRVQYDEWVSIEFLKKGHYLLSMLEAQLILHLQPELNTDEKNNKEAGIFDIVFDNKYKFKQLDGKFLDVNGLQDLPPGYP